MGQLVDLRGFIMAGEVDAVSEILGRLRESKETITKHLDRQDEKLDRQNDKLDRLIKTQDSDHSYLEDTVRPFIKAQTLLNQKARERRIWLAGVRTAVYGTLGFGGGVLSQTFPKLPAVIQALFHAG